MSARLIDSGSLERTEEWVKEAKKDGAKVLTGGKSRRPVLPADGAYQYKALDEGLR